MAAAAGLGDRCAFFGHATCKVGAHTDVVTGVQGSENFGAVIQRFGGQGGQRTCA